MLFSSRISKNNGILLLLRRRFFLCLFLLLKVQSIFLAYSLCIPWLVSVVLCHHTLVCGSHFLNQTPQQQQHNNESTVKIAISVKKKTQHQRSAKEQQRKWNEQHRKKSASVECAHRRSKYLTIRQIISSKAYRQAALLSGSRSWAICFKFTHSIGTTSTTTTLLSPCIRTCECVCVVVSEPTRSEKQENL